MNQIIQNKTLSIFLLIFTLSIASQQLNSFAIVTKNNQDSFEQPASASSPLLDANKNFSNSVDNSILQIGESSPASRNKKLVNFDKVLADLQALESSINTIKFYTKNQDTKANIDKIEPELTNIRKILTSWQSNFNQSESIIKSPKKVRNKNQNSITNIQGEPDQYNLAELQNNLLQRNQKLYQAIDELDSLINAEPQGSNTKSPVSNEEAQGNNHVRIIIVLLLTNILSLFTGLGVGILGTLLFQKNQIIKKRYLHQPGNNKSTTPPYQQRNSIPPTPANGGENTNIQPTVINPQTKISPTIQHPVQPPDISTTPPVTNIPHTHHSFTSFEQIITTEYNQNSKLVCKNATEVAETADSINQRRSGVNHSVIVEKVRRGKGSYCITPQQGFFYLLPKDNLKINQFNYETVNILFECYNYQPGRSTDFRLKRPAVVASVTEDTWRLQTKGTLEFV